MAGIIPPLRFNTKLIYYGKDKIKQGFMELKSWKHY